MWTRRCCVSLQAASRDLQNAGKVLDTTCMSCNLSTGATRHTSLVISSATVVEQVIVMNDAALRVRIPTDGWFCASFEQVVRTAFSVLQQRVGRRDVATTIARRGALCSLQIADCRLQIGGERQSAGPHTLNPTFGERVTTVSLQIADCKFGLQHAAERGAARTKARLQIPECKCRLQLRPESSAAGLRMRSAGICRLKSADSHLSGSKVTTLSLQIAEFFLSSDCRWDL